MRSGRLQKATRDVQGAKWEDGRDALVDDSNGVLLLEWPSDLQSLIEGRVRRQRLPCCVRTQIWIARRTKARHTMSDGRTNVLSLSRLRYSIDCSTDREPFNTLLWS